MKRKRNRIILLLITFLFSSCVTVRIGMSDPNDTSRYSYIDTNLWINLTIKAK